MKRKIFILLIAFMLVFVGTVSAKSMGLSLEVGGLYTNHQLHRLSTNADHDGFKHHSISSKDLGGISAGLIYKLPKSWALFVNTMFAFNSVFVNDTQLGFGYIFRPGKGFELFLGGGLALGGSKFKYTSNSNISRSYFNVGGGISFTASYMITGKFGIYLGVSDTYYKPVLGKTIIKSSNGNKNAVEMPSDYLPKYAKSINARLGLKVNF